MLRVYFTSLGCKLNQAEVEALSRQAASYQMSLTSEAANADWAVVNTCAVTQAAAQKSRQAIRRLRSLNPCLHIAVIGCYATIGAEELRALPGVDILLPNSLKESVLEQVSTLAAHDDLTLSTFPIITTHKRTRAQVKIQDGCDNHCTYCVVCIARGAQRSVLPEQVLSQIRERLDEGYKEIVLTGVHIGAYGHDSGFAAPLPPSAGWSLAQLVKVILAETEVPRLRLSSIEPWDMTPELLHLWPDDRLCRHLHLPMQSGSNAVLCRMGRHYSMDYYTDLMTSARNRVPDMAITTDLITGFPGETEEEHLETLHCVESLGLARLHVFTYSPRPGTTASDMPEQVSHAIAQHRSRRLIELGSELAQRYRQRYLGRVVRVLFESSRLVSGAREWNGLSDNYLRVVTSSSQDLHNRFASVLCTSNGRVGLTGDLLAVETR
ncbi:MAG: tRNA (N(6)-L-threonylcarbamoyladenosine(37)-C(2))-methylthiotransferase MtaB [Anaerolineae bacterium]